MLKKEEQFQNVQNGMNRNEVYSIIGQPTTINPKHKQVKGIQSPHPDDSIAYADLKDAGTTIEQWLYRKGRGFAELVVAFSPEGKASVVSRTHSTATK